MSLRISHRLWLLFVLSVVAIVALVGHNAMRVKSTLVAEKMLKTRHVIESAYGVLEYWQARAQSGAIDEATAKREAVAAIKQLRYEGKEYFWLHDLTAPVPKMIMHPTVPALDGKVLDAEKFNSATSLQAGLDGAVETTDGKKNLFVAFNEVVERAGHGYVNYLWPKPISGGGATKELYPKLSYVKKFPAWGWVIGSGIYIDDVAATVQSEVIRMLVPCLIAVILLLAVAWMTIRHVSHSLRQAGVAATAIAGGDLTYHFPPLAQDEVGGMMQQLVNMRDQLRNMIGDIRRNAEQLNQAANGLASAAGQSAQATTNQYEAASSMAASVEQLSVSIDHVGDNAREALDLSNTSSRRAAEGGQVIHQAANEMGRIAEAVTSTSNSIRELEGYSDRISTIVKVIKEIADQTNLLALNAAIEAARAGEQGRGFAVVADEVRKLAERTTSSTMEISGMIASIQDSSRRAASEMETGVTRVGEGVQLAHNAGDSIGSIQDSAGHATLAVQEITTALKEQASATREVAQRVESIAQSAESNRSIAQGIAQSAQQLAGMSSHIEQLFRKFRVN